MAIRIMSELNHLLLMCGIRFVNTRENFSIPKQDCHLLTGQKEPRYTSIEQHGQ